MTLLFCGLVSLLLPIRSSRLFLWGFSAPPFHRCSLLVCSMFFVASESAIAAQRYMEISGPAHVSGSTYRASRARNGSVITNGNVDHEGQEEYARLCTARRQLRKLLRLHQLHKERGDRLKNFLQTTEDWRKLAGVFQCVCFCSCSTACVNVMATGK